MPSHLFRYWRRSIAVLLLLSARGLFGECTGVVEQGGDPDYRPSPFRPTLSGRRPKMLFEESHFNFYTVSPIKSYLPGKFKPFAQLASAEGFVVDVTAKKLDDLTLLKKYDVVVTAGASAVPIVFSATGEWDPAVGEPAFTAKELDVLTAYVRQGGNLIVLSNHAPLTDPYRELLARFRVQSEDSTVNAGFGGAASFPIVGNHPVGKGAMPFRSGGGGAIRADVGTAISRYPKTVVAYGETLFNFTKLQSYGQFEFTIESPPILLVLDTQRELDWRGGGRVAIGAHAGDYTSKLEFCNGVKISYPDSTDMAREDLIIQNQNVILNTLRWLLAR